MASRKLKTAGQVNKELMVEAAIKAVKERGLSENAAAVEFGVCRMTMRRRIENPNPEPHGGKTKFPQWAEDILASFLLNCSGMGVPLNRYHCVQLFSELATEIGE
ncbi:hypothetical protein RvY_00421 [Ramazzottius varieornatus]|uniref:HTH psq-type domain-containing protein n=1 Tax=Ramazzottius varieornatus TaxID=947166 RepID=A0A1D1UD64_RAMVA|nr:hypothetical protein RvY_00421 [Ramazzottius varieornatus]